MSAKSSNQQKKTPIGVHLLAGGGAGLAEALVCHPLDTIKVSSSGLCTRSSL
jgi:solute carrier family 25 citrate transporter 1